MPPVRREELALTLSQDPRWGRGSETPGEDPFRIMSYVKSLLIGLEGTDAVNVNGNATGQPIKKIIATCKHFAGYDLEDWDGDVRYGFDALITSQDLAEYYLPPFQQCARDSNVGSVMCSYNAVNGVPSCANSYLMETILREHWGWTVSVLYMSSYEASGLTLDRGTTSTSLRIATLSITFIRTMTT